MHKKILAAGLFVFGCFAFASHGLASPGFAVSYLNLRAGPDQGYPVVAHIPANAPVDIQGCVSDWGWCDVAWGTERGWVSGHYLQTHYMNRPTYIVESGPVMHVPVVQYDFNNYWDSYYRQRAFYQERARYERDVYNSHEVAQRARYERELNHQHAVDHAQYEHDLNRQKQEERIRWRQHANDDHYNR